MTLPQAALAYVRTHPAVVSTVVGLGAPEHAVQAAERAAVTVPGALWQALAGAGLLARSAVPPAV